MDIIDIMKRLKSEVHESAELLIRNTPTGIEYRIRVYIDDDIFSRAHTISHEAVEAAAFDITAELMDKSIRMTALSVNGDETAYLNSSEANKKRLEESIEQVENNPLMFTECFGLDSTPKTGERDKVIEGPSVTYRIIDEDSRGLKIPPELCIQMKGTDSWYPVSRVLGIAERDGDELMARYMSGQDQNQSYCEESN